MNTAFSGILSSLTRNKPGFKTGINNIITVPSEVLIENTGSLTVAEKLTLFANQMHLASSPFVLRQEYGNECDSSGSEWSQGFLVVITV